MEDHPILSQSSNVDIPLKKAKEDANFLISWNLALAWGLALTIRSLKIYWILIVEHCFRERGLRNKGPSPFPCVLRRYSLRAFTEQRGWGSLLGWLRHLTLIEDLHTEGSSFLARKAGSGQKRKWTVGIISDERVSLLKCLDFTDPASCSQREEEHRFFA